MNDGIAMRRCRMKPMLSQDQKAEPEDDEGERERT